MHKWEWEWGVVLGFLGFLGLLGLVLGFLGSRVLLACFSRILVGCLLCSLLDSLLGSLHRGCVCNRLGDLLDVQPSW